MGKKYKKRKLISPLGEVAGAVGGPACPPAGAEGGQGRPPEASSLPTVGTPLTSPTLSFGGRLRTPSPQSTPPPSLSSSPISYSSALKTTSAPRWTQPLGLPKFRVVPSGGTSSYAAVVALETENPAIQITARPNLKGEITVTPKTPEAAEFLKTKENLLILDPGMKESKAFILHFHASLPVEPILALPNVCAAERVLVRGSTPINKVLATFRGPIPARIHLNTWGSFPTSKFVPEPLRCFKCNRFGHHKARCTRPAVCGICSGKHDTDVCLAKFKNGQPTTPKCPNCAEPHHAWFRGCRFRLERLSPRSTSSTRPQQPTIPLQKRITVQQQQQPSTQPERRTSRYLDAAVNPPKMTCEAFTQTTDDAMEVAETPSRTEISTQTERKPTAEAATATTTIQKTTEAKATSTTSKETGFPHSNPTTTIPHPYIIIDGDRFNQITSMIRPVAPRAYTGIVDKLLRLFETWEKEDNPEPAPNTSLQDPASRNRGYLPAFTTTTNEDDDFEVRVFSFS